MKRQPAASASSSRSVVRRAWIAFLLPALSCGRPSREPAAASSTPPDPPYLGQQAPGLTPEKFAPGVVNTDAIELNGVFTPDGREFFFTRLIDGVDTIHRTAFENGRWSDPLPLALFPEGAKGGAVDMAISPGGEAMYFLGEYPLAGDPAKQGYDIWVSRKVDGRWAAATLVPPPVSTPSSQELYPVVVRDGSLYFISNRADGERYQLYRAQKEPDGQFADPVALGPPIANSEFGTGDTFVAPDESYLVFASRRPPGSGQADLFVSFRGKDGSWSDPVNLGQTINTADHEFCPMVTPDGKYLFFSRRVGASWETTTAGDVYWVDAKVLEGLRPSS